MFRTIRNIRNIRMTRVELLQFNRSESLLNNISAIGSPFVGNHDQSVDMNWL